MAKKISFGLSVKEIQTAIKEIKAYQNDLNRKCEELCFRLCAEGMPIARAYIGESGFGRYIRISSEITPEQMGCKAAIYMEDTAKIKSEWQVSEQESRSAELSPSLLIEFGSGLNAKNPANVEGVGQGTFPGQSHAFDKGGWWYKDMNDEWHHSNGVSPKMPMYKTGKELRERVLNIAREVFNS